MSDRPIDKAFSSTDGNGSRILSTARPEEREVRGDGWTVIRALLLILGGIAIVSYVMMTLANLES